MKDVGFIIVNYNNDRLTFNCIESLFLQVGDFLESVVIVCNGTDESFLACYKNYEYEPIVTVVKTQNRGFSAANNVGIEHLRHNNRPNSVVFLNNDTIALPGFRDFLAQPLSSKSIGGCLILDSMGAVDSTGAEGLNWLTCKHGLKSGPFCDTYVPGTCIRLLWDSVLLWDERYFLYFEDVQYSIDLKRIGYSFRISQVAGIVHLVNSSTKLLKNRDEVYLKSQLTFLKTNHRYYFSVFVVLKFLLLLAKMQFPRSKLFLRLAKSS